MQKKKLYYGWIVTLLAGLTYFGSNGLLSASAGTIVSQVLLVKGWGCPPRSVSPIRSSPSWDWACRWWGCC